VHNQLKEIESYLVNKVLVNKAKEVKIRLNFKVGSLVVKNGWLTFKPFKVKDILNKSTNVTAITQI